jgi:poly(3-hydroxybutyrate) depolymerase
LPFYEIVPKLQHAFPNVYLIYFLAMQKILLLSLVFIYSFGFAQNKELGKTARYAAPAAINGVNGTGSIPVSSSLQTNNPRTRTFTYHLPATAPDCNRPLLIVLHGDSGTGAGIMGYAGFNDLADTENFLAVYPDALGTEFNKYVDNAIGHAGSNLPNAPDDVKFVSDIIDYFFSTYGIDRSRVYVTGHSGGAFMAYHLALADGSKNKISAIAPVAASVWGDLPYINSQSTVANYSPTAIMHLHCTADATVAFPAVGASYTWPLSIFSTPACGNPAPTTTVINAEVDRLTYCGTGKKIELIKLKRASLGHGWPTLANAGYDGAAEIWNFVKTYTKGTYAGTLPDPVITPFAATIAPGQSITLTASGCNSPATNIWKQGATQVGTAAVFNSAILNVNTTYTAYCATATCQSAGQNVAITVSSGPLVPIVDNHIKVDQFGYRPIDKKIAVISKANVGFNAPDPFLPTTQANQYQVRRVADDVAVFTGTLTVWNSGNVDASSGDQAWWFDFSSVNTLGNYYVYDLALNRKSYNFTIGNDIYSNLTKQAVKALYYQRCGVAKTVAHGGIWNDTPCHTHAEQDTDCRLASNPIASTSKDLSGGWHDAGDYNKYVNLAYPSVEGLLYAFEEKPMFWGDDSNIPESGNNLPDILDELKIELDWLLKMQQADGSVLSKVSVMSYTEGSPASSSLVARRYAPANTTSALSFAAMCAHASLVYRSFPAMQTYANALKTAAINAYAWALANPAVSFSNAGYASANVDGGLIPYGRDYALKISAAIYLYNLTSNAAYKTFIDGNYTNINMMNFVYEYEGNYQDAMLYYANLPSATPTIATAIKNAYKNGMDLGSNNLPTFTNVNSDPYRAYTNYYSFNNNHFKAFKGLMYQNSLKYKLNVANNQLYTDASLTFLNYLHGVNPLAKTYVSNASGLNAENSVNEIYHTWFGDGTIYDGTVSPKIGAPPGFLVCGADQAYLSDGGSAIYNPPANQPAQKSYLDFNTSAAASWVTSEIAIYNQATYTRLLEKFITHTNAALNVTYCLPVSTAAGLELTGFTLAGTVLSQNTGWAENGYGLFANSAILLNSGSTFTFSTQKTSAASHVESVWIDYNRDGDFDDAGEQVATSTLNSTTNSGSFVVPNGIGNGYTRIRIRLTPATSLPCASPATIGETEDYVIELSGCPLITPPSTVTANPNPVNFGNSTTFLATGCGVGNTYLWKNGNAILNTQSSFTIATMLANVAYTAYCVSGACQSTGVNMSATVIPSANCPDTKLINGVITPPPFAANTVHTAASFATLGTSLNPLILTNANTNKYTVLAGKSIEIKPGVSISGGAIFKAEIANCANLAPTMYVQGRNLYDVTGQQVIPVGMNVPTDYWQFSGTNERVNEINTTGANMVRLVWFQNPLANTSHTDADLDSMLTKFARKRIFVTLVIWDGFSGCPNNPNKLNDPGGYLAWWTDPAKIAIFNKHKKYLILNLVNELGFGYSYDPNNTANVAAFANWSAQYTTAINSLRTAGLHMPIMIDAPLCGGSLSLVNQAAPALIAADPDHNLLFGVHSYWAVNNETNLIAVAVSNNIPVVFGEVASKQVGADSYNTSPPTNYSECYYGIDGTTSEHAAPSGFSYKTLLPILKTNNIGYLHWEWFNDGCPGRNMTTDGNYNTLTTYGLDAVNHASYGINTAVKSGAGAF